MQPDHFCFSGTLGDSFIVYCKLYDYWKKTGKNIKLYRYSRHVDFDKPISALFSSVPFIEYQIPCNYVKNHKELTDKIRNSSIPYINVCWDSKQAPFSDPPYIKMDPYPEIFLTPINEIKNDSRFTVGIQLQSGKMGTNFKGFSFNWLKDLKDLLPDSGYDVFLFGTGEGYNRKRLDLFCKDYGIKNLVGQLSFKDWLRYMLTLDFFITFEGFSAFFAMSQKIPSLVFYMTDIILKRVPPSWRRDNKMILTMDNIGLTKKILRRLFSKTIFFSPLPVSQVKSFLDQKIE